MKNISITHVSNSHNMWLRSLDFYANEIKILTGILTEIAGKNTGNSVMKEVEHFENQFKLQIENIHILTHDIKKNSNTIADAAHHSSAGYIDGHLVIVHNELEQAFEAEEKIIKDLRSEFQRFATQWM